MYEGSSQRTRDRENLKTIESLGRMAENTEVRKFIRPNEAVKIYGICRQYLENIAAEAGAPYKIGRVVLINVNAFEAYLELHKV